VLESQKLVTLVPEAISSFAAELDAAAVTAAAAKSGTMFPIKFDNQEAEVGRDGTPNASSCSVVSLELDCPPACQGSPCGRGRPVVRMPISKL
jgi:hypothetical protein